MSHPLRRAFLTAASLTFAAGLMVLPGPASAANPVEALVVPPAGTPANQGYKLFMFNCAHCHGTDARGDEGPDLHGVTKSDKRITAIIQNGIKGEMPKFSAKLNDADTRALVAFIRTLSEELIASRRSAELTGPDFLNKNNNINIK